GAAVLYYDAGKGFNEEDKSSPFISGDGLFHELSFRIPFLTTISGLRFDPPLLKTGEGIISRVELVYHDNRVLHRFDLDRLKALHQIKDFVQEKGEIRFGIEAGADDPQIDIHVDEPLGQDRGRIVRRMIIHTLVKGMVIFLCCALLAVVINTRRKVLSRFWPYAIVLAATLVVSRDWWNQYLLGGHSAGMDYIRMVVLDESVRQGDWWPRFNETLYYGYGSLLFHFLAPFSFWLTELFVLPGVSVPIAIKITMGLTLFLSGLFIALLAKDLFGPFAAAAAGTLYVLAPYHLTDMLARHAFGEAIAFAWIPLALWGVYGAVHKASVWRMLAGALGVTFLLLTHNITAMISGPLLLAWWIYWVVKDRRRGWRGPLLGALAGVFGLLLAAFFWLPAFAETDLVWSKRGLIDGYFVYWDHFVYFTQFFSTKWAHEGSFKGPDDPMSFQLGMAHWIALLGLIPAFIRCKRWRGMMIFWSTTLLLSLLMCHEISEPVWRMIPTLAFVQFPWRFLVLAVLAASLAAAPVAQWLAELRFRHYPVGLLLALLLVVSPFIFYYSMTFSKFMLYDTQEDQYPVVFADEIPGRLHDKRYQRMETYFTKETIRDHLVTATASDEWLPKNVVVVPRARAATTAVALSGEVLLEKDLRPYRYEITVNLKTVGEVRLNRFWYPGWQATVDGNEMPTYSTTEYGLVTVRVPEGEHRIIFNFGATPLRTAAWVISAIGLIGLLAVMLVFGARGKPRALKAT
ncbi:MAG: hypothetical protein C0393_07350, partial [Anaerolinea sp.]|nr:hypothetical protein [Anaerolinea sp.]